MAADAKIVILTGANSGIGKAAAARFARAGLRVVMACRDAERGERARREVVEGSGSEAVEVLPLDLSSFASVRAFADAFLDRYPRLDLLIHNAGTFEHGLSTYQYSADGLERTFAINTFGPFLLTERLLDALARSEDPRVLNAGSTNLLNFYDPKRTIEFDNLRGEHADTRPYRSYKMYGDSKMGLLLLTRKMAEVYADRGIRVNCVMIPTVRIERASLQRFHSWYRWIAPLLQVYNPFALSPAQMAEVYHHLCTAEAFRDVTGALIDHRHRVLPALPPDRRLPPLGILRELLATRHAPPYAGDPENVRRMWDLARAVVA